jgi:hypothetical protein
MKTETTTIDAKTLTIYGNIIIGLAFLIPFLISGPQLLTGSLVNCFLILSTRLVDKKNHLTIAVLPSIAAVLNGLVFGKFTPFLVFFLPFIWIGNFVLIKSIIYLKNKLPLSFSMIISIILKTIILYISALVYFKLNLVPKIFLTAMGVFQLVTGIMGGLVFLGINKFIKKNYS